ncbi:MAG: hypothetical protein ACE5KF_06095 [Kiloniellaceae bacterium]
MTSDGYDVPRFVSELRAIVGETADEREIIQRVRPLAVRLAGQRGWRKPGYYHCESAQGFGVHLLHEEPNHDLAVFAVAWLPGRGTPPHDHGTWAVVAGVDGPERNTAWRRLDNGSRPGYAELAKETDVTVGPGEAIAFLPEDIHSVINDTDTVTMSLHVYGRHINYTGRSQFDPVARTVEKFILKVA